MSEWRADEAALRVAIAGEGSTSPAFTVDQLRDLGYMQPAGDAADARAQAEARDARLLARLPAPPVPAPGQAA